MMNKRLFCLIVVALSVSISVRAELIASTEQATPVTQSTPDILQAQTVSSMVEPPAALGSIAPPPAVEAIPTRDVVLSFAQISPGMGNIKLRGIDPIDQLEFGVRSDEVVSKAILNLEFTPSPSLLPTESQVKVYLNDELMGVIPIAKEQLGKKTQTQIALDPRYITDFNRIRLEFVGHYRIICENPASNTLWVDIGKGSKLNLTYQALPLNNDLSHFPEPFFDRRDSRPLTLPMVFADVPDVSQQRSAAILASWFGARAQWRGQRFPVWYNALPDSHAIVFATNNKRPDFLRDYPAVKGATVEMISHPKNPYVKLLLILGRDDNDLQTAVRGIVQGNLLLRGASVDVKEVKTLAPRQPYDAPNWVRTDRTMTFSELQTFDKQLQSSGVVPSPIALTVNLPPDLYLVRNAFIDMDLKYRYTTPQTDDGSRMSVSLNDQFVQAFSLVPQQEKDSVVMRLPLLQGLIDNDTKIDIPALRLGANNQLRFDFSYANPMPGGSIDNCVTYQPVENHVVIDGNSTIDFTGYRHFMAMPDLRAYANAGFPFSRMADLSQTTVVVGKAPHPAQLSALLDAIGTVGAQTGYPALEVKLTDDWRSVKEHNDDIMLIGNVPNTLKDDSKIDLLVQATESWVKVPSYQPTLDSIMPKPIDTKPDSRADIRSAGPMAAIIGFQSPFNEQRSVVALLADSPRGYELLNQAINDSGKRATMSGSVVVIRESGVNSLRVGDIYYVGHLPWWERLWHAFIMQPVLLAVLAVLSVVLMAWVLWRLLRILSRRRLSVNEGK